MSDALITDVKGDTIPSTFLPLGVQKVQTGAEGAKLQNAKNFNKNADLLDQSSKSAGAGYAGGRTRRNSKSAFLLNKIAHFRCAEKFLPLSFHCCIIG